MSWRLNNTTHKLESLLVQAKASEKVESVIKEHSLNTDIERINRSGTMNQVQVDWSHWKATFNLCSFLVLNCNAITACTRNLKINLLNLQFFFSAAHFLIFQPFHIALSTGPCSTSSRLTSILRLQQDKYLFFLFCSAQNNYTTKKDWMQNEKYFLYFTNQNQSLRH